MVTCILSKVSYIGKESATFWTQTTCSSEELYCETQTQPMDWLYTQVSQICAIKVNTDSWFTEPLNGYVDGKKYEKGGKMCQNVNGFALSRQYFPLS